MSADGIRRRGFASLSPERRREIASMGGIAAHQSGRAHEFTSKEAREAGKQSWIKRKPKTKAAPQPVTP